MHHKTTKAVILLISLTNHSWRFLVQLCFDVDRQKYEVSLAKSGQNHSSTYSILVHLFVLAVRVKKKLVFKIGDKAPTPQTRWGVVV